MKKILTLLVAVLATASVAHAQFGIIGGFTSSKTSIDTKNISENFKGVSLFHAGIAYKVKLPLGFAIQPALTYEMKGANLERDTVGYRPSGCPSLPPGPALLRLSGDRQ